MNIERYLNIRIIEVVYPTWYKMFSRDDVKAVLKLEIKGNSHHFLVMIIPLVFVAR